MLEKIVLAIVVVVTIVAHILLYKWVRFKIDEGLVLEFFRRARSGDARVYYSAEAIAADTGLEIAHVAALCARSKRLEGNPDASAAWCLSR